MSAPKGMRITAFPVTDTDAVHIYSDAQQIWLQFRRHVPTQQEIGPPSFKVAVNLTPAQAISIARELLAASTCHQDGPIPSRKLPHEPAVRETFANHLPPKFVNQGKPWTRDEDKKLSEAFDAKTSIPQIAKAHQRSVGAIKVPLGEDRQDHARAI